MKKYLIPGVLIVTAVVCNKLVQENPVCPLPLDHNGVQMKIGDRWLYKRFFINSGISASLSLPDTLVGYSYFEAVKDTAIDGKAHLIIEGRDYEVDMDSIRIFKKRFAIHFSDTVISMYEFKTGEYGFLSGVLRRTASRHRLSITNYGTTIFKILEMQKLAAAADYDTTVYCDFVYPILFPLKKDSIYTYRDSMDSNGNLPYRRKFCGIEWITVPAGSHEAYKFEWLAKEAFGIDSLFGFDWIGNNGLLKRYWDFGKNVLTDEWGVPLDTCYGYDILEKIGENDINPDTLVPWGKKMFPTVLYSTSFESPGDTAGWNGMYAIQNGAPQGGGDRSVYVAGGCVQPHAWRYVTAPYDCRCRLRCWGKSVVNSGSVSIATESSGYSEKVSVFITDTGWNPCFSFSTLSCRKNQKLRIEMSSGGDVEGGMLIDCLEIDISNECKMETAD